MDSKKVISFLDEDVKPTVIGNQRLRDEKEKSGDFFNIFSILRVERNEVYTHSAILCELLNPKGSHGMGDTFLRLFLNEMPVRDLQEIDKINLQQAKISKEKDIGRINIKEETGGQIDILIEFENQKGKYAVVIENKIDAKDQRAQLARYYNYAIDEYKNNFSLFYLTKYGNKPSEMAIGKKYKDKVFWTCVSYRKNVKEWLKKCIKETDKNLPVKETIKQYINLIDKITDQEIEMSDDNKELIKTIYSKNLSEIASEFYKIWEQKDSLIAEMIAEKIKDTKKWKTCIDGYGNQTTIFRLLHKDKYVYPVYLFFESSPILQIGFYCKKGFKKRFEKNLEKILTEVNFTYFDKTSPYETGEIWYLINISLKTINTTSKQTIDSDYFNDIKEALDKIERDYGKLS